MQPKIKLSLRTAYGDSYLITDNGDIIRTDMPHEPSGQWKLQGIEHVQKRWFIPFAELTPELLKELPLTYKNGNPQFTVRDLDHGTTRVWGNTKYHGIKSISFVATKQ